MGKNLRAQRASVLFRSKGSWVKCRGVQSGASTALWGGFSARQVRYRAGRESGTASTAR